jgi:hypothetical protein
VIRLVYQIVEALDSKTLLRSESAKHRIGRIVHVSELSLFNPAIMYYSAGTTVTSEVLSWTERIDDGSLDIETTNTIYKLKAV